MMEEMAAAAFSGRPQPRAIPWKVKFIPDGNQNRSCLWRVGVEMGWEAAGQLSGMM